MKPKSVYWRVVATGTVALLTLFVASCLVSLGLSWMNSQSDVGVVAGLLVVLATAIGVSRVGMSLYRHWRTT